MRSITLASAVAGVVVVAAFAQQPAAPRNDLPQPYRTTRDWGQLPAGVKWAAVTAVEVAPDGTIYVVHRCFANSCAGRSEAPILKYNAEGKLLASWGQGMFLFPHGGTVDRDGNLWMTDARGQNGKGNQVFKFSPDGKVLLTLGKPGVSGSGPDLFDQPTDVVVAPNGDIFVTDSHRNGLNNRIVKFTKDGKYIKEWGRKGAGRGELSEPHTIAMDSRGRLFVGDRENNRIQIFDQEGNVHRRVAAVRPAERDLHHPGRHDLRRRLRVGPRHRRPRAPGDQEGHPHRQRPRRVRHGLHRGHGVDRARPFRRRRRRRRRRRQRLRRGRAKADAGEACQKIKPAVRASRFSLLGSCSGSVQRSDVQVQVPGSARSTL